LRQGIDAIPVGVNEGVGTNIKCLRAAIERLEGGCDILRSPDFECGDVEVIEAIRGTKAKVAFYLEPGRDYRKGLQEIGDIVEDRLVQEALRAVSHVAQQPSLIPQEPEEQEPEEEVAPAPPLSR
jgi:hypothetical protein